MNNFSDLIGISEHNQFSVFFPFPFYLILGGLLDHDGEGGALNVIVVKGHAHLILAFHRFRICALNIAPLLGGQHDLRFGRPGECHD